MLLEACEIRNSMGEQERTREFLQLLTASQRALYAFIRAQVNSRADADDLVQQTTAILWEKFASFDATRSFVAWACGIAWREVLSHRRQCRRRRVELGDELGEVLAEKLASASSEVDQRLDKLHECLGLLKPESRQLVELRYFKDESVDRIAARSGSSESSIFKTLTKVRQLLLDCVQRKLKEEA
jgi:RNA polymerase sigma-70 factor (ECF subfamily)